MFIQEEEARGCRCAGCRVGVAEWRWAERGRILSRLISPSAVLPFSRKDGRPDTLEEEDEQNKRRGEMKEMLERVTATD